MALFIDGRYVALQAVTESANVSIWNTLPPLQFSIAISFALILAIAGYFLKKLTRLFYVYEFSHVDND